jgi:hypothetical protein
MKTAMLPPDHPDAPKFWMYESSGVLRPVVEAYLKGQDLSTEQIGLMRAYLHQWVRSPVWKPGSQLEMLRLRICAIETRADITDCLAVAEFLGIDPL